LAFLGGYPILTLFFVFFDPFLQIIQSRKK
jgi:hypothetical protein